ncbi:hypothetical protein SLS54_010270 [Diplodia seriata]
MTSTTTTTTTTTTAPAPTVDNEAKVLKNLQAAHGDWRDDLARDGYAVIKGAIPPSRAAHYRARAHSWLTSFGTPLSLSDPSTWSAANLPVQSKINTFSAYSVSHEAFMWEIRLEPGVVGAFASLWGTDELLVSFDALNVTLPAHLRADAATHPAKAAWPHVDQSPLRRGACCVQGVVNLSPSGARDGGLVVYPGTHRLMEEFFATETDAAAWEARDLYMFSEEQLAWFAGRGCAAKKVVAEPGDLLVWDSRTVHWGAEPESEQIRTVVYASYAPAKWASEAQLREKAKIFGKWAGTTHWPHDNIVYREGRALLPDGSEDPRNRSEPREKPVLGERLLKLAGAVRYDGSVVEPAA